MASASLNFKTLDLLLKLLTLVTAGRRESVLKRSSLSNDMKSRLISAPFSATGLFGNEVLRAAVVKHKDAALSSALTSLARKNTPQRIQPQARKRSAPPSSSSSSSSSGFRAPPKKKPLKMPFKPSNSEFKGKPGRFNGPAKSTPP